jgi:hypothetical protein
MNLSGFLLHKWGMFLYAVISLQSTIIAIIPANRPAAIPSARIAIGTAAELGVTVADAEVEVETTLEGVVELVTTLVVLGVVDLVLIAGVVRVVESVVEDVDVSVGIVIGIEVLEVEIGSKLEVVADVKSVLISVNGSDGVL